MLKNMFGTRITKQHNTDYPIHFTIAKFGKQIKIYNMRQKVNIRNRKAVSEFNFNKFQHI